MKFYRFTFQKSIKNTGLITAIVILTACADNDKKVAADAARDLGQIEQFIAAEDYQKAKTAIDSFHVVYRKKIALRKQADVLSDTVSMRESRKNISYLKSVLPEKLNRMNELKQQFNFEKDTKRDIPGIYIHKNQDAVANANRDYINAYFDENGLFYLVSNHIGKNIRHNQLRISSGEISAETGALSSGRYYDVEGQHFEKLSIGDSVAVNLVELILANQQNSFKAELKGNGNISYLLTSGDKKCIVETYEFWKLKTETDKIEKEITRANKRIQIIELKKQ